MKTVGATLLSGLAFLPPAATAGATFLCGTNGDQIQQLRIYEVNRANRATMDSRWKSFLADQEWIGIKKRSAAEHDELVKEANGQPLVRVSYSPACKADQ
jgi:hypothetical protein